MNHLIFHFHMSPRLVGAQHVRISAKQKHYVPVNACVCVFVAVCCLRDTHTSKAI